MDKWIALAFLIGGILALVRAYTMETSFDDGTFMAQMLIGLAGGTSCLVGLIWLGIIVFVHA